MLNPIGMKISGKLLAVAGVVVASLVFAIGVLIWQLNEANRMLGVEQAEHQVCIVTNSSNQTEITNLEDALRECIGEKTVIESELAIDQLLLAEERRENQAITARIQQQAREAMRGDACAHQLVLHDAVERVREAAACAVRAGRSDGPAMGAGACRSGE